MPTNPKLGIVSFKRRHGGAEPPNPSYDRRDYVAVRHLKKPICSSRCCVWRERSWCKNELELSPVRGRFTSQLQPLWRQATQYLFTFSV